MKLDIQKRLHSWFTNDVGQEMLAAYVLLWTTLTSRYPVGSNIFDEDWDLLIVLDACRVDAIQEVTDEYSFIEGTDTRWSLGSTSKEWIDRTFVTDHREAIRETAYITANPFSDQISQKPFDYLDYDPIRDTRLVESKIINHFINDNVVESSEFRFYDPAWYSIDQDDRTFDLGITTPFPEEMTERAVIAGREIDPDRMIVHYMQPHQPYLAEALERGETEPWEHAPFDALRNDEMRFERVWGAYIDNLRYVLDHVEILLENYDASRAVITADHGELFGEMGLYGHLVGLLHPNLRKVPWVETAAGDTYDFTPSVDLTAVSGDESDVDISEHLKDLGYLG